MSFQCRTRACCFCTSPFSRFRVITGVHRSDLNARKPTATRRRRRWISYGGIPFRFSKFPGTRTRLDNVRDSTTYETRQRTRLDKLRDSITYETTREEIYNCHYSGQWSRAETKRSLVWWIEFPSVFIATRPRALDHEERDLDYPQSMSIFFNFSLFFWQFTPTFSV